MRRKSTRQSKATKRKKGNTKGLFRKVLWSLAIFLLLSAAGAYVYFYQKVFKANVAHLKEGDVYLYIRTNDDFQAVVNQLAERRLLLNVESFVWLSEFLDYHQNVKPGRYKISPGMSNKDLVRLLKSGRQEPLKLVIHSFRTMQQLAGKLGSTLEADSAAILEKVSSKAFKEQFGLTEAQAISFFLPNTYEFYWNTTTDKLIERMGKEYQKFWNETRLAQAQKLGLSPGEVATLASIVQLETLRIDEMPRIAGVYLNRLRKGQKLEADPTVIFANDAFGIQRVKGRERLQKDSPYNTYRYPGLPPGPIYLPKPSAIDAVLNAEKHGYFYFCAKPDGSGYHTFATTFDQHMANARAYHRELNRRGIK